MLLTTPCHSILSSKLYTILQFVSNHVIEFPSYSCLSLSRSLAYFLQSTYCFLELIYLLIGLLFVSLLPLEGAYELSTVTLWASHWCLDLMTHPRALVTLIFIYVYSNIKKHK